MKAGRLVGLYQLKAPALSAGPRWGVGGLPQTNNPTAVVGRASPCSQSRLVPEADHQCDKLTGIPAALWEANEDFLQSGGWGWGAVIFLCALL